ncbi:MAG TPA: hypothetical protein RMH99_17110 [Sandaracinaceae bacterium LLY-WYZ-13_1]|nr:hypothetical protein [Sandaracinaceae bacterium LLY-WYZ-13_1]
MRRYVSLWLVPGLVFLAGCPDEMALPADDDLPSIDEAPPGRELGSDADPRRVERSLLGHLRRGELEDAYALTSDGYRAGVPFERFRASVADNPYLATVTDVRCHRFHTAGDDTHWRECVLRSEAGPAHTSFYYAREEDGWRATGIVIGGVPAFPGPEARIDEADDGAPEHDAPEHDAPEHDDAIDDGAAAE